jgi:hypothetical protein
VTNLEPLWRLPTRAQAIEVLVIGRKKIEKLLADLDDSQFKITTLLGGGNWSVKDLLGHLASVEEDALAIATGKKPRFGSPGLSVDELNAARIRHKTNWTAARVREDFQGVRADLLNAIETMGDEGWKSKIPWGQGRSALGLVLGKKLVGGRHGLFAHDLAHLRDLERSVKALSLMSCRSAR